MLAASRVCLRLPPAFRHSPPLFFSSVSAAAAPTTTTTTLAGGACTVSSATCGAAAPKESPVCASRRTEPTRISHRTLFTSKRSMSVLLEQQQQQQEQEGKDEERTAAETVEQAASWLLQRAPKHQKRETALNANTGFVGEKASHASSLFGRFAASSTTFSVFGKASEESAENVGEQNHYADQEKDGEEAKANLTAATATATTTAAVRAVEFDIAAIEQLLRESCGVWVEDCLVVSITDDKNNNNNNSSIMYARALVQLRPEAPTKNPVVAAHKMLQCYAQHYQQQQQQDQKKEGGERELPPVLRLTAGVRVVAALPRCHRGLLDRSRAVEEEMELVAVQGI